MTRYTARLKAFAVAVTIALVGTVFLAPRAEAHCDMLNGPVIIDARKALEDGNLDRVLKWVTAEDEGEVRAVFDHVLKVRNAGPEARALADRYFFETLVRLHRAGEGFPYTGIKPAGDPGPVVRLADQAVETGEIDELARRLGRAAEAGVRERFARAVEKRRHADRSVHDGREYVEAYVSAVHYLENLHAAIGGGGHHGPAAKAAPGCSSGYDDHDDDRHDDRD